MLERMNARIARIKPQQGPARHHLDIETNCQPEDKSEKESCEQKQHLGL